MNTEDNFFRYLELVVGDSAESLTAKLKLIPITFQLVNVWSDGGKHYAHVNAGRPFPKGILEKISKIK